MISYLGDFAEDATVYIPFNTFDSNDPTASATITNLAAGDIKVHKDGGLTQIVTDGATVIIDYDGITGNHLITIDTSAHADYSVGSDYQVRMEGTTVDAGTINAFMGSFSIENRFNSAAVDLANGTDGLGALKADIAALIATVGVSGAGLGDLGGMSTAMKAEVNAEAVDVLTVDTHAEPGAVPAATASLEEKIGWLFTLSRNKALQTSTTKTIRNDADSADIATSAVADNGTTFTRDEFL